MSRDRGALGTNPTWVVISVLLCLLLGENASHPCAWRQGTPPDIFGEKHAFFFFFLVTLFFSAILGSQQHRVGIRTVSSVPGVSATTTEFMMSCYSLRLASEMKPAQLGPPTRCCRRASLCIVTGFHHKIGSAAVFLAENTETERISWDRACHDGNM